ncbi:Tc toxin subunit A [Photorhabdus temperata]|uniref:Tc toxin subunit A-related protein n=1 Tax=Photorhabdus temperata TaxID=574560 RepID=UPI0021D48CD0|nr:neuraminidase-like domain-containing protein [Photorhabdus temperata]MCT8347274.1 Tc toxin subunit A [Photorhabdus temperata]
MNTPAINISDILKSKGFNSEAEICHLSFDEFRQKVRDKLSWSQTFSAYLSAQQEQKKNRLHEARILKRANPQLQNAIHSALKTSQNEQAKKEKDEQDQKGYNSKFGNRASKYAAPGAVSSMFSPAAYLTELYRQARDLHANNSDYHLDKRRPDLQSLAINQKNMDSEISTLSLSNDILLKGIKKLTQTESHNHAQVMEKLSTFRTSGMMPYHDAYENVRKIIQLQAPVFEQSNTSIDTLTTKLMYQISLLGINASVSPELFTILTEKIKPATNTDNTEELKELYKKNFGEIKSFQMARAEYLKSYYNLIDKELNQFSKKIKQIDSLWNMGDEITQYYLLKFNKAINLSRATELSPTILNSIAIDILKKTPPEDDSDNPYKDSPDYEKSFEDLDLSDEPDIDEDVLREALRVKGYMQRYSIDAETALILCKAPILENPSHPDLTKLLADIHQLTIDELSLLLEVIDEGTTNLSEITHDNLTVLIDKLYAVTGWLRTRKWSVYQLFVMTTDKYNETLTPEIHNLLDTIYNGLQDFDKKMLKAEKELKEAKEKQEKSKEKEAEEELKKAKENLPKAISPYIAAALQLPSENIALSVLAWVDKLNSGKENKMTADSFWNWLRKNPIETQSKTTEATTLIQQAVQYCQCLAQLALIYRSTGLNENALNLFVKNPQRFVTKTETTPATQKHDVLTLTTLMHFADWVNSLGEKASSVLTEFEKGTLTAELLANTMNLDKNLLEQASTQAQADFSNWPSIDSLLQWINISLQLNISPQGVSELAQVLDIESSANYTKWENVASILTAGLDTQKANALHAFLDESRSTALSTYYIYAHNQKDLQDRKDAVIKNRDDLYQYLLIDNQVSAAIKTTEIAEAIASIQLYVNQALKNMEGNIVTNVTSRPFFKDWDKYNKHYSTWAGISKLAYYPENYIDPTMRIGQTKMMDALLQSISQSQLNTDTVEDAFKSYLTSFEQVANLEVISAYHDNINNDQGLTYFIGHSETDVNQYYWRSVDHNKFSESKFPANAWSEWHKIDCPINPYKDTIRPVIYQSRLYIIWLEEKRIATHEGGKTTESFRYEMKLAHIRYDGTWNTPITFDANSKVDVHSKISDLTLGKNEAPGLYCASFQGKDKLLVMFYKKQEKLNNYTEKDEKKRYTAPIKGLYITSNMSPDEMTLENYIPNSHKQFDTNNVIRVNNRYAESYEIPSSVNSNNGYDWGKDYLSMVYGGNISAINLESQSSNLKIKFSPRLRIIHNGLVGRQRNQCNLIKKYGKLGDKFIIYTTLGVNLDNSSNKLMFYPIYQYYRNTSDSDLPKGRLLFYRDTNYSSDVKAWIQSVSRSLIKTNAAIGNDYAEDDLNKPSDFKHYIFMTDSKGTATDVSGPMRINTNILPSKVKVIIKGAGIEDRLFVADESISPSPNFEEMNYQFKELEIDISTLAFHNNEASIDVTFTAFAEAFTTSTDTEASEVEKEERHLGEEHFSIRIIKKANVDDVLTLHHDSSGAQYMQWRAYRTRLNTLFARKLISRANAGIDTILSMETQNIQEPKLGESSPNAMEPMDFSGANSLYFWELFYYTPMLIAQRLLHEQNFDEANRWLKHVWNPSGYIKHDQIQDYHWNVRPLQEDTSWNDDPLDSVDPDAIAQHDPMHYKVATFMRTLDLLMARGDYAYRQLERDTLNEAKMWYMQALHLLGDKPHLSLNSTWDDKSLNDAANPERQKEHSRAIAALQTNNFEQHDNPTDLFLPQVNEVMLNYWQTLEQRLYNLRHNLSIDGQPLHLPIYATPADPKALLSAAVASSQGGSSLPTSFMSLWRFPHMLENARGMVSQLTQFGSTLQNIIERQDAEALNTLLQNQAAELILTNLSVQDKTIEELDAEKTVLEKTRLGAQSRFNSYSKLYDENINSGERQALDMRVASQSITAGLKGLHMAAAALDMVPNIYGMAVGGSHYGAIANAIAIGGGIAADGLLIEADKVSQSEIWRRRRQEWEIQRNNAQAELKQIDAQLGSLTVRREAAVLQKTSLKTQQEQTHAQLVFLQRKFSNQALYNWLRGRLAAIYFQFYDLAVSRCLMAEMAYRWETNETNASFIKPGAWQGTHAGLLAGETLMLNLAQMEDAHLRQDQRVLEVERTVSLAEIYKDGNGEFSLTEKIANLVKDGSGSATSGNNTLQFGTGDAQTSLQASISLADLQIRKDYPEGSGMGNVRRIKQISVTLPALLGPYQDVQAILSYGNKTGLAKGCEALAISHGMNDSGQFQLDFNDGKFLPFEGIDVDQGTLTLSFPNATGKQKTMLESLNDIILHIRYTIRQ